MIEIVPWYRVGQTVFPTIQEAQYQELYDLIGGDGSPNPVKNDVLREIILQRDKVVAILTEQPRTKKVRSDKGKKRAPKTAEQKDKP